MLFLLNITILCINSVKHACRHFKCASRDVKVSVKCDVKGLFFIILRSLLSFGVAFTCRVAFFNAARF